MATTEHPSLLVNGKMQAETDFAPGIEKLFALDPKEDAYLLEDIQGKVPAFISGSYYLNGPAKFSCGDLQYRHWLDGDGMVCQLRFGDEGIYFARRFVRTAKFNAEQQAGEPIFRTFGTAFPGDVLKRGVALESPGNVSAYPFHGSLLAFGEQALPWQLDPNTLVTLGPFNFGGMLTEMSPFAAHPKFDSNTGEMFNFGTFFSGVQPKLCLYCFDQNGKLRRRRSHPMEFASSIHDFGLSQSHLIFYVSPYLLDANAMIHEKRSLMDCLEWRPELGSQLLIFSRESAERVASVSLPGRYCLHLINCAEENGRLTIDVIELERPVYDQYQPLPNLFTDVPSGGPVRLIVDLNGQKLLGRQEMDYHLAPDFPAVDPVLATLPYEEFWMLGVSSTGSKGRKFFDQLVYARWDQSGPAGVFRAEPGCYLGGEPIFLGSRNAGEGAVICQQFDANREESSFLIFNARDVSHGPVASLRLKDPVHLGFHASFNPTLHTPLAALP